MENGLIAESTTLIGQFETSLGVPTFGFFANWSGEYSVDADERAGRLVTGALVERLRDEPGDQAALIIAARGGYPAFADVVLRTARQLGIELEVLVPCRIDAAAALVAAAADTTTLHPQGGLGAVDAGLCVVPRRPMDASLFPHCPVEPAAIPELNQNEQTTVLRLAFDRFVREEQRRMASRYLRSRCGEDDSMEWLLASRLGAGLTVGATELKRIGFDCRVAPDPLAEQLEQLLQWARKALHLFESPSDRFEVSDDIETEVEFEPAELVSAAAVVGTDRVWLHQLDTGSPDPDVPRLLGQWHRWNPELDDQF